MSDDAAPTPTGRTPHHVLYRAWSGAFPPAVCRTVLDEFAEVSLTPAGVQTGDGRTEVADRTRDARHVFIEPSHWAGALVSHFARQANLLWRYDLTGLGTLSIVRYDVGGHFHWHVDLLSYEDFEYPRLGRDRLFRKLSVTVNLSDPGDYDGGDLEFMNGTGQAVRQPDVRDQGSVVVFPSTVGHRVTAVTRGTRYALVGWMVGPQLR